MTTANLFFAFDILKLKVLGYFVFQGTLKRVRASENHECIVLDVENYHPILWGDIRSTFKNGAIEVRVSEIMERDPDAVLVTTVVPLPCGVNPKSLMEEVAKKITEKLQERIEKISEQREKEINQFKTMMDFYSVMPPSNDWSS